MCNALLRSADFAVFIFATDSEERETEIFKNTPYQLEEHLSLRFSPEAIVLFEKVISLNHCDKLRHEEMNTYIFLSRFSGMTSSRFSVVLVPGFGKCFLLHAEMEYLLLHIVRSNPVKIMVRDI